MKAARDWLQGVKIQTFCTPGTQRPAPLGLVPVGGVEELRLGGRNQLTTALKAEDIGTTKMPFLGTHFIQIYCTYRCICSHIYIKAVSPAEMVPLCLAPALCDACSGR